jgi:hypothetical protein
VRMFLHRLGLDLGRTVRELEDMLTPADVIEWMAYFAEQAAPRQSEECARANFLAFRKAAEGK